MKNSKVAWCVVTDNPDDLISLRRFAERQLWLNSKYPVLALVSENIKIEDLQVLDGISNLEYRQVPKLEIPLLEGRYKSTIMKMTALLQEDFDLLWFIETDTIIRTNLDYLLDQYAAEANFALTFFDDSYAMDRRGHFQGISFAIKPDKAIYYDFCNYMNTEAPNKFDWTVDETVMTDYIIDYLGYSYDDAIFVNSNDLFKRVSDDILHYPGAMKPWHELFTKLHDVYYNYTFEEFNKFIDDHIDYCDEFQLFTRLIYLYSSYDCTMLPSISSISRDKELVEIAQDLTNGFLERLNTNDADKL